MLERLPHPKFDGLVDEWTQLVDRFGATHPFLSHAWLQNWLSAFGTESHEVLLMRQEGAPVAGWVSVSQPTGLAALEDHTYWPELVHVGSNGFAHAVRLLAEEGVKRLELHGPQDPLWRAALERAAGPHYVVIEKHAWPMRHIDVAPTLDKYLATRPPKVRAELRRKMRRFEERFPGYEVRRYESASAEAAFAVVDAVERDSWKSTAGTAIVSSEREQRFYRGVLELPPTCARPVLFASFHGNEPIAYLLGLQHRATLHALKTSYRAAWADSAPGLVLLGRVLEQLGAEEGVTRVELLGRDSRWKREVATGASVRCVHQLMHRDVSSRLYSMAHQHVRPLLQRIQQAKGNP